MKAQINEKNRKAVQRSFIIWTIVGLIVLVIFIGAAVAARAKGTSIIEYAKSMIKSIFSFGLR